MEITEQEKMERIKQWIEKHSISLVAGVVSLINIINVIFSQFYFFDLLETQLLYFYSSIEQIIGTLLGLIIAVYGMISPKRERNEVGDQPIIEKIKETQYWYLLRVLAVGGVIIFCCLLILASYEKWPNWAVSYFMTEAAVLLIPFAVGIYRFIQWLRPSAYLRVLRDNKAALDYGIIQPDKEFTTFLSNYNELERIIFSFSQKYNIQGNNPIVKHYAGRTIRGKLCWISKYHIHML